MFYLSPMMIIATIGHGSLGEDKIRKIILAGADLLRYNFSYRVIGEHLELVKTGQRIIDDLHAHIGILIDLPLTKIRLGDFDSKMFAVRENDERIIKSAAYSPDCDLFIPVDTKKIGEKVTVDQTITIGDGEVSLQVIEIIDSDTIKVRFLNNGIFHYMKTFNIKNQKDEIEILKMYTDAIDKIAPLQPQYISISYLSENLNEKIIKIIRTKEELQQTRIIVKIENYHSREELIKICQNDNYSHILIDRGEIAVNIPFEQMGIYQKEVAKIAGEQNMPTIVSTQILESTINNFTPSRADITDLTNMVLDGINGIMFCMETSTGNRPTYPISVAKRIIGTVEKYKKTQYGR